VNEMCDIALDNGRSACPGVDHIRLDSSVDGLADTRTSGTGDRVANVVCLWRNGCSVGRRTRRGTDVAFVNQSGEAALHTADTRRGFVGTLHLRMTRLVIAAMPVVLVLGACGSGELVEESDTTVSGRVSDISSTSVPADTSPSSIPLVDSTTTTVEAGRQVTIAVSGWVGEDARGTVLCPSEFTEACPGIPTTGDLPPTGNPVRATGTYDGVSLRVEAVESWTPYERDELFNPCTGGSGPGTGGQSPEIQSKVEDALVGDESRMAGMWLADGQLVVALTGPDDELAERIRAAHHRVCVDTGYPSSQEELITLASNISLTLMFDEGVWILDSWDSVVDGAIRIRVEAIDTPTMNTVAGRYGEALDLTAYIEVLDAPLADLPEQQPPVPADLVIPTAGTRGGISMAAQAIDVVLILDAEGGCLFHDQGGGHRQVVVWPFGYSAVSGDPTIVYDPAGNEVARTGVPFDLGGGGADINNVDPAQRCDADSAFQTAGPTRFEFETVWPQHLDSEDE
jgi:hypothetical protein